MNDSVVDLDNEFGYMTDEDSIFHSFAQEVEKTIPRLNRMVACNKDPSSVEKEVKDMLRRVSGLCDFTKRLSIRKSPRLTSFC